MVKETTILKDRIPTNHIVIFEKGDVNEHYSH